MFDQGSRGGLARDFCAPAMPEQHWPQLLQEISSSRAPRLLGTQPRGNTCPYPFLVGFNAPLSARGPKHHRLTFPGLAAPS